MSQKDAELVGLETVSLDTSKPTCTLIMIHGMCNHDKSWVSDGTTYLGLLEASLEAHLGHTENLHVLQLVQCGSRGMQSNHCR